MPIYEYQCPKCGKFDVIQKMSERPLRTHDACGSKVRKLLSAGSFSFKGTGFYITDYKKTNGSGKASEKKNDSSSSAVGGGKTTEKTVASSSSSADSGKAKSETTSPAPAKEKSAGSSSSKEKAA
jgi:putative FmdB family regulatory protein